MSETLFDIQPVFEEDDYLYFYSDSLTDERTETEVAALVRYLKLEQPLRILDLACGFGRHTNRLAALGHQMTGVDIMEGFLELARRDAQKRAVTVDYRQGDMRAIEFEDEFDRIILAFTAFGYFDDAGNLLVLWKIAQALKPGGLMIFDSHNRDLTLKNFIPAYVVEKEGNLMIDRMSFDSLSGLMTNRRIVIRNGARKDKPFAIRYYNPSEIHRLLEEAGLKLQMIYGGWEDQPVGNTMRMVIIAQKPVVY